MDYKRIGIDGKCNLILGFVSYGHHDRNYLLFSYQQSLIYMTKGNINCNKHKIAY